jgi:hypothetical protein
MFSWTLCLLVLAVAHATAVDLFSIEGPVYRLDDLTAFLTTHPRALVMFYAPWDTKSQSAAGAFSRAAEAAEADLGAWGAVDCTVARQVCKGQQIKGFPVIKLFDGDKDAHLFSGPRLQVTDLAFLFCLFVEFDKSFLFITCCE